MPQIDCLDNRVRTIRTNTMVSGRLESPPLKPVDGVGILVYFSILRHAIFVDDDGWFALSRFIASPKEFFQVHGIAQRHAG